MRPGDRELANHIKNKLHLFSKSIPLPGIESQDNLNCFVEQVIDSVRRIKYITTIRDKNFSQIQADATRTRFDPLKAAVWNKNNGNLNEAYWLIFLSIHFGKNLKTEWNLVRDVYKGSAIPSFWSWERVCVDTEEFIYWLDENQAILKANGNFGNHRKYQSLKAFSPRGTGATIRSYIRWIGPEHDHQIKMNNVQATVGGDPKQFFNVLYRSMSDVMGFGRTAKFDYLTMIGKFGLVNIIPDSTYMTEATGPFSGARLLFGENYNFDRSTLDSLLIELEDHLGLDFGMQVLEDALCNWQKTPNEYKYFRG